jgi:2-oxoglutarate ferredoxin oxidoreductase subunit alpha
LPCRWISGKRRKKLKKVSADPKGVLTGAHYLDGDFAIAEGALAAGCRFFAGYPITPSTETAERFAERIPFVGGVFIQMEDELASIAALIGAAWSGKKVMTVTSGPGFSLMMENIGLACMMEVPLVIANVQRGGPSTGLPTLTAQQDMMQARWGSHGDYAIIALCPDSPQECFDLTIKAFNLSETYRVPTFIMADECVGHMHERVVIPGPDDIEIVERKWYEGPKEAYLPYKPDTDMIPFMVKTGEGYRFHATGLTHDDRGYPVITAECQAVCVPRLVDKIKKNAHKIIEYHEDQTADADVVVISYGITSRVTTRAVMQARQRGLKVGTLRLVTVWPFPEVRIAELSKKIKAFVVPELNYGQMVYEVERCAGGQAAVIHVPHCGGWVHNPDDIFRAIKEAVK